MAEYVLTKKENIVAVANAVRNRTGKEDAITLAQIADDVNYVVGGVELPDLAIEGEAYELFLGKELIDGNGNVVTGTFTIDNELNTQNDLITQIQNAVNNLPDAGGGEVSNSTCTVTFDNSISEDCAIMIVVATVLENGVRKTYTYTFNKLQEGPKYVMTIPNCVCNTSIVLVTDGGYSYQSPSYVEISGSALLDSESVVINTINDTSHRLFIFTSPSVADENCTIYYAYEP